MAKSLFDLKGKVALITGSTRGIGKSIAEELALAGCKVVVSSRKAEACEAVRAEFEKQGFEVLAQPCNVSRKEELQALYDKTVAKWGRVDIAVANAAANPYYGPLAQIPDEAFDKVFHNNVKSVLWLAGITLPAHGRARRRQLHHGGLDRRPAGQHGHRRLRHLEGGRPPPGALPRRRVGAEERARERHRARA